MTMPREAERVVSRHLRLADRLLPGRVHGFYVVGSTALGAFRAGGSDVDFVAVLDRRLARDELRRLRLVHVMSGGAAAVRALGRGQVMLPGTPNGVYVAADDLTRPVSAIVPVASHTGHDCGIAVRGPAPGTLGLDPEPETLRAWNLRNLDGYWRPWAERILAGRIGVRWRHPRWPTAWGVLGAPRLHRTIATGEVVSKEAAGELAVDTFDAAWHPIIREALAYWRGQPAGAAFPDGRSRTRRTAEFVLEVVRSAHDLPG